MWNLNMIEKIIFHVRLPYSAHKWKMHKRKGNYFITTNLLAYIWISFVTLSYICFHRNVIKLNGLMLTNVLHFRRFILGSGIILAKLITILYGISFIPSGKVPKLITILARDHAITCERCSLLPDYTSGVRKTLTSYYKLSNQLVFIGPTSIMHFFYFTPRTKERLSSLLEKIKQDNLTKYGAERTQLYGNSS